MITKMTGTLNRVLDDEARVEIGPFEYQVLISEANRRSLQMRLGQEVTFHVSEYYEGNQSGTRLVPRKIGFLSEHELDFFDLFCTVDKIGAKKALKAMGRPIKEMADAIQRQDVKWLTTMPGIGKQSADQIIATLKNKVTRFAMAGPTMESQAGDGGQAAAATGTMFEEAYAALMTLGLAPVDARNRLDQVAASGKPLQTTEDVLNAIFRKT